MVPSQCFSNHSALSFKDRIPHLSYDIDIADRTERLRLGRKFRKRHSVIWLSDHPWAFFCFFFMTSILGRCWQKTKIVIELILKIDPKKKELIFFFGQKKNWYLKKLFFTKYKKNSFFRTPPAYIQLIFIAHCKKKKTDLHCSCTTFFLSIFLSMWKKCILSSPNNDH